MRSAILRRPMLILLSAAAPLSLNAGEPGRVLEMPEAPEALEAVGARSRAAAEGAAEPPARSAVSAASPLERWLEAPPRIAVRSEVSGASKAWRGLEDLEEIPEPDSSTAAGDLSVSARAVWSETERGRQWQIEFEAAGDRAGHEVSVELPVLSRRHRVFTPSEHGTISLDFHPT
ncbi:MAG: hypothetical protein JXA90_10095, partial [Planctomycetes bacterium]|nr:hypothetical protein [Planctomycetota bacterium]